MSIGNDYPVYIKAPHKVNITTEKFDKLSYIGLSSILCSYPALISKLKDGSMIINMSENNAMRLGRFDEGRLEHSRFNDTIWTINNSAELVMGAIPKDHPVIETINNYYSHLIME